MSLLRHELRSPLTGIMGMCSLLQMADLRGEQRKWVLALSDSARQMKFLISRLAIRKALYSFSSQGADKPVNALLLLESVVRSHWPSAREKGIELCLVFEDSLPELWSCDETRLRQLIDNLLTNAIKFTQQGHVLLEVSRSTGQPDSQSGIECVVSDTGIGISDQDSDRIYQVREQGSMNQYLDPSSSGLGLYVCRNIAQSMEGSIQHRPNNRCGTTFIVTLPQIKLEYSKSVSVALLEGMSCLVALAEPLSRSVVTAVRRMGLRVETVSRGGFPTKQLGYDMMICMPAWLEEGAKLNTGSTACQEPVLVSFQSSGVQKSGNGIISSQSLSAPILYSDLRALFLKTALERIWKK